MAFCGAKQWYELILDYDEFDHWEQIQGNLNKNAKIFILENAFENVSCNMRPFYFDLNVLIIDCSQSFRILFQPEMNLTVYWTLYSDWSKHIRTAVCLPPRHVCRSCWPMNDLNFWYAIYKRIDADVPDSYSLNHSIFWKWKGYIFFVPYLNSCIWKELQIIRKANQLCKVGWLYVWFVIPSKCKAQR